MDNAKLEEVQAWLTKGRQDLLSAQWLVESPQGLFNAVGFHCQQAVEKALKAYLTWHEQPFEKTHSLVALVSQCLPLDIEFETLREAATTLTPYAVTTRYPGDLPEISLQEAEGAVGLAKMAWDFIVGRIPTN